MHLTVRSVTVQEQASVTPMSVMMATPMTAQACVEVSTLVAVGVLVVYQQYQNAIYKGDNK